ncbi:MAG: glycosyltransferase family 2 protein [Thermoanaerobaculia bacterium]|nr:glycosyltransferase family 2 protein [Thermoanaerobaculia bacterium]
MRQDPRPEDSTHPAVNSASPLLTVLIPFYDEGENLAEVLAEVVTKLDRQVSFEVLLVDDGSEDIGLEELERLTAGDSRLRYLRHARNRGKSAALVTGAMAARGEWLGTMDGDGQNDPADLLALLREAERRVAESGGVWLVAGQRRRRRDTWSKRFQSRIANRVRRGLLHDDTPDTGCGLKVMPRKTFLQLPRFAHMHRFLPALVQQHGGQTTSVMVEDRPRAHGVSKYSFHNRLWVGILDVIGVMWLARRALVPTDLGGSQRMNGDSV